ncbi:MAG: poly(R)-hydroxyalkanoic acid synthase subunit PhaE [Pseudomonadota bacterium]
MGGLDAWLQLWKGLSVPAGPAAAEALGGASAAFTRFASDYARLAAKLPASPAEQARWLAELETLARSFYAGVLPAAPIGTPVLAAAFAAWSAQLGVIARDTATRFAVRLATAPAPATLRETFDAWIDCAEAAFQQAARGEAFVAAQAQLFNELVRLRAGQQALAEQAARLAGVPSRAEVDALHDSLRSLRAELAARPAKRARRRRP